MGKELITEDKAYIIDDSNFSNSEVSNSNAEISLDKSVIIPLPKERKGNSLNLNVLLGVSISFLLIGFVVGNRYSPSEDVTTSVITTEVSPPKYLTVETIALKSVNSYVVQRSYTGEVVPMRVSELSFERSGKIETILVDQGDRIKKGKPIAKIDTSNLNTKKLELIAQKSQAEAELAELKKGPRQERIDGARANIANIEQQLALLEAKRKRREYLYQEGAISLEQLDEFAYNTRSLSAQLDEANIGLQELLNGTRLEKIQAQEAVVKQLTAAIADIDINLAKSTIKAPFTGTISLRYLDEGTVVNTGQSVVKLVENGKPEVHIGVPVPIVEQLKIGSQQTVTVNNKNYQGRITSILPEIDEATRTQTVVVTLSTSAAYKLPTGVIARLNVEQAIATQGFWLPTTALIKGEKGLWSCYVVSPTDNNSENIGQVEARDIEVLHTQGDRVLVRGTLNPGEKVVSNGTHRIVPEQIVRTQKSEQIHFEQ